ncbi:CPBP family intramembrane metalloprotease [Salinibacterium sp. dk2585]|uniref:CPBP family intramembrane glutamic endopeptidase n=1 Tax=unclassified Salinibacterium TaxID=2632331 RepID=UPI0011C24A5F|nr:MULTISPECIES: CPBP family intramembrane glutamic endopeptidase [unclassified Salinibacterium]QEE60483.1 CPBP family intramembrane metalloprotease [Salinibacterium sp. dk2585]TXK55555.1 CPBP family intramembrane metalloprotease [Salinibacterium sp. dk5596]
MTYDYHRLPKSWPRSSWWKPLVTGLIALAIYIIFTVVIAVPVVIYAFFAAEPGSAFERLINEGTIDMSDPWMLAFALASVALMLPAIILATLIMGPRPVGLLSSVVGRLRWGWMLRLALPALAVFLVVFAVYVFVLPLVFGEPVAMPEWGADSALLIAFTLLLVPVQATAEEYVFRGYLMQTIGTWLKHPAWAILLPVPLFVAGHIYDVWGSLDVAVFAVFAGWITWRTGGLEAAIVAHVINNGLIFILGAVGLMDTSSTEGSPIGVAVTAVTLGVYGWWVVRLHERRGEARTRDVAPEPLVDAQP